MAIAIEGQMSLFDIDIEQDRRPCRYKFHRYIGQRVNSLHGPATITKIDHTYYTEIRTDDGRDLVGTPHDLSPRED